MRNLGLLFAAAMLVSLPFNSVQAAIVVGGNPSSLSSLSGVWSWDGSEHSELRAALEDPANFGPGGIGGSETFQTVDLPTINAGTLSGIDIFVSSWWQESESSPFETDIINWFLNGGNLVLLQDDPDRDGLSTLLGFQTISGTSNPTTLGGGALGNGPFGAVGPVNQVGDIGHFDNLVIAALGGLIEGVDAAGQATVVSFAAGVLGPSAGALVALSDVDLISGFFGGADFSPLNDKGILALNAFAFLQAEHSTSVPLPASLPLFVSALLVLGAATYRRRLNA